ncbi:MAG: site-specific DNA-methyltransferase [Alphaproteobacteria bacterium]|nr:site-specific DNA-methyltransferase [Alphaproteobacteria bacterium]
MPGKHARAPEQRPLAIRYHPIAALKPDPKNPRAHSRKQIRKIADSIAGFGFNVPLLVDAELRVIAGHGRLLACRELGWSEVPTIALDHLSEAQARAFMIADNRLTEIASWDDRLLAEQLHELSLLDLDFSLELTGFEIGEIDLRIQSLDLAPEAEDPADAVPEPAAGPAVSRVGDLWLLGEHRVLCGSALDPEAYRALMGEEKAAMVFTDPPYNVPIEGHASGLGAIHHRPFPMASGEMDKPAFTAFLAGACHNLAAFSTEASLHFICMDWRHIAELLAAGADAYGELKNLCVWAKDNAGMGSLYRSQHELVFVFKNGREAHRNNVQLGQFGRNRSNLWRYPGVNSFARSGSEGNLLALHPTVKPVAMVADAILDCTARRDIVLDAFLGSGTTVIAAERTGRRCFALELDPLYVDTAIRRWQAMTGKSARLAATAVSFDDTLATETPDAA